MLEALPERIHPDGLAFLQRLLDVSLPLALDPQVLELDGHVRAADVLSADSLFASVPPNTRRADEHVGMGFGFVGVMGDAANDHNSGSCVASDLDLWERFLLGRRCCSLEGASPPTLTLISESQLM